MAESTRILTSWNEIASHLGKGVRTVQRWERELGLPVRRPGNGRHVVVARGDDLDRWVSDLNVAASPASCCECESRLRLATAEIFSRRAQIAALEKRLDGRASRSDGDGTTKLPFVVKNTSRPRDGNAR